MNTRPQKYTISAIIQFVWCLMNVGLALMTLPQGAAALDTMEGPGYFFTILNLIVGLAGLFSAYGVWKNQKWGVILTMVIEVIYGLTALPGLIFAPTLESKIGAYIGVLIAVVVIALLLWPKPKFVPVDRTV